ncbi:MAG: hypothetical protein EP297_00330 [Gammaproteobacteria bacterium]|nr:MAG: hypothetical protein EP297_00330 [Gammaproteobacteria bacterium]
MNVFILNTGRCGSTTFIKACEHIDNYTSGHESRLKIPGKTRLSYPANHIEADNRLSWLLGRLDQSYGDDAFYVHLSRDKADTVDSFVKRRQMGIIKSWREGVYLDASTDDRLLAEDYIDTVNANIRLFLQNKKHQMQFSLEQARQQFAEFWRLIGAEGNLEQALKEWDIRHNKST